MRPSRTALARAVLGLGFVAIWAGTAGTRTWAGDHHDGRAGAALDPGFRPGAVPYDGPVPGWRPPGRGDSGPAYPKYHPNHLRCPGPSIPGLWRYPSFHGFIPPPPHDDGLYRSGKYPWQRG